MHNIKYVNDEEVKINGLSDEEVKILVSQGKTNFVPMRNVKTLRQIIWGNVFTFFNMLCFAVAIFLIYIGATVDSSAYFNSLFIVIVAINLGIGIFQEARANAIISKLRLITQDDFIVIRNGTKEKIKSREIVLGDILVIKSGDQVPCDLEIISGACEINESIVTGEGSAVIRRQGDKALCGSTIISGTAYAQAIAVGRDSYINSITNIVTKPQSPRSELLKSLRQIIRVVGVIIVILVTLMIIRQARGGVLSEYEKLRAVTHTAGAVIGMIPSGMFLLVTFALAGGAFALAKHKCIVKDIYCVEMLARADTICFDKTGTLTDGTMTVDEVIEFNNQGESLEIQKIISSMMAALGDTNTTASALIKHFGSEKIFTPSAVKPFSSETKRFAVEFSGKGVFALGAPEFISTGDDPRNKLANEAISKFVKKGRRVVALSRDGIIVAIIIIRDNIRHSAREAITWFNENGVTIKVISGDNEITTSQIATMAGINGADKYISVKDMTDDEIIKITDEYTVFGRTSPRQKEIIIKNLRANGHTVAMTGDGINDILALREADCSIALGSGATPAKQIAHMVLLEDDFGSLPQAVYQGRRVIKNLSKSSALFMYKSMLSIMLAIVAVLFMGGVYLFTPRNLYLLEIFVLGIPAFILSTERSRSKPQSRFMKIVLVRGAIGATTAMVAIGAVYLFYVAGWFGVTGDEAFSMAILVVTGVGFIMLVRLCLPINRFRIVILSVALVMIIFASVVAQDAVGLWGLGFSHVLLIGILVTGAWFAYSALERLCLNKNRK